MAIKSNNGNNLDINIPDFLNKKYPNWIVDCPQIYQLNENLEPIQIWNNKKEVAEYFHKRIQGLDLALRKGCRFQGFFWVIGVLFEKEGLRPLLTEKRNEPIYAYNPSKELLEKYYNREHLTYEMFKLNGYKEQFQLIRRFKNSVEAGKYLDLSITNIRRVAKKEILFHKDYFFSFTPLKHIHEVIENLFYYYNEINFYHRDLREQDKLQAKSLIEEFKVIYSENRFLGNRDKKMKELIDNNKFIIE